MPAPLRHGNEAITMAIHDYETSLPHSWHYIRQVRTQIMAMLSESPKELQHACAMTASELLENGIKYGEPVPALSQVCFSFEVQESAIVMSVQNGALLTHHVEQLQSKIAQMMAAESREELYTQRLLELMENRTDSVMLGLYRIGFEGRFDLHCTYEHQVVTVTATRGIEV
jgi:anti-sigma regulatory factor (Ser/Thr protein kinase)